MEWLTVGDKARLAHSRAWWTHVPPRYNARQARLVIEESILWPAIIDAPRRGGATRLTWACANGKMSRVVTLLKWGADVNKVGSDSWTPLMWACYNGHIDIAQALLAAGASKHTVGNHGVTAVSLAGRGTTASITALLAATP